MSIELDKHAKKNAPLVKDKQPDTPPADTASEEVSAPVDKVKVAQLREKILNNELDIHQSPASCERIANKILENEKELFDKK